ncbi:MAG TPA: tetratricopeptide repeat protein [Chthoniobacterales bacterium]|nr:tetratricopeptide repeat protein [Chthoniobacterales bacterium]
MAVRAEKELDETQRSHWLKAVAAVELRNFGYAISLLQAVLKQEPEFLAGRQLLRRAELMKMRAEKKPFFKLSTASVGVMKAQRELKKDPKRALELIEKVLEDEPYNRQANLALKEAAVAAGWPEIGVLALQTLLEEKPADTKLLHELARLYRDMGNADAEVDVYNRITAADPLDADALRLGKDASARASMKTGGWTEAESYRDLIKDKDLAVSLEQQNRMALTGESLDQQIAETYERHQAEPQSVDCASRLGSLYEQKEDFESAIAWFQYAADLTNGGDAGLVRKVSDLGMRRFDQEIAAHEEFLTQHGPDDPAYAERHAALEDARKKRAEILIDDARRRSERNPTDLQLRFELGEHLLNAGRFRDALPELQRARQNPNARLKAMNLLGRCYRELGMLDLAAKQLEEAAREILSMDRMKKEIVYNLGLVFEQMGDAHRSIDCMKQIYEIDYGYRDVAGRVESSYRAARASG